jgi:hypothetical protein
LSCRRCHCLHNKMRTQHTRLRFEEGEFTNKYTEFDAAKKGGFKGLQRRVSTAHQRGTAAAAGGGMQRQSADACPACCAVFRSRTLDDDEYIGDTANYFANNKKWRQTMRAQEQHTSQQRQTHRIQRDSVQSSHDFLPRPLLLRRP